MELAVNFVYLCNGRAARHAPVGMATGKFAFGVAGDVNENLIGVSDDTVRVGLADDNFVLAKETLSPRWLRPFPHRLSFARQPGLRLRRIE
jgi:hypothetical protein